MAKKTWREKLENDTPEKLVKVDSDKTGWLKKGQHLYVSNPQTIKKYVEQIRKGSSLSIKDLREKLAKDKGADITCPMTTSIFLRIVAEVAIEDKNNGRKNVTPYWRVISPKDKIAKKLSCGVESIKFDREAEGIKD